jgi:hypothetical protein
LFQKPAARALEQPFRNAHEIGGAFDPETGYIQEMRPVRKERNQALCFVIKPLLVAEEVLESAGVRIRHGHFALETDANSVATKIDNFPYALVNCFLNRHVRLAYFANPKSPGKPTKRSG